MRSIPWSWKRKKRDDHCCLHAGHGGEAKHRAEPVPGDEFRRDFGQRNDACDRHPLDLEAHVAAAATVSNGQGNECQHAAGQRGEPGHGRKHVDPRSAAAEWVRGPGQVVREEPRARGGGEDAKKKCRAEQPGGRLPPSAGKAARGKHQEREGKRGHTREPRPVGHPTRPDRSRSPALKGEDHVLPAKCGNRLTEASYEQQPADRVAREPCRKDRARNPEGGGQEDVDDPPVRRGCGL